MLDSALPEDMEIVAQGSIDYNGRTIAYVVSKMGNSYFLEISFVNGSKQDDKEKKIEFKFEQKEDGKFYLNSKEAPFFHDIFIEKIGTEIAMVLNAKDKEEVTRLTVCLDRTKFVVMGREIQSSAITLNGNKTDINFNSLSKQLNRNEKSKIDTMASRLFKSIEIQISGRTR